MTPAIDYDRLAADYNANLIDTLRGFGPAADFLGLWVPDEDPLRSLANMLDAACASGCPALDVAIGAASIRNLERDALARMAAGFGTAEVTTRAEGGLLISVRFDDCTRPTAPSNPMPDTTPVPRRVIVAGESHRPAAPRLDIPVAYAAAIAAAQPPEPAEPPADTALGRVQAAGVTLALWLDGDGVVRHATHDGATDTGLRGVLSALCRVILGLPAQEVADHGVIRLERSLRDFSQPPAVPGVITPPAVSPLFALAERLLRGAVADWRTRTGMPVTGNTYAEGPRPGWLALDEIGRRALLAEVCSDHARSIGGQAEDIEVVAIEYDVRILVRLRGALAEGDRQHRLMILERHVKRQVDPQLELFFEPAGDANRIRRLSGASTS